MASNLTNYNSSLATDPLRSFRFTAQFNPHADTSPGTVSPGSTKFTSGFTGGFTSISGLNINIQNIPYREGGYNTTVHQIPGMTTFQPVTFSRGVLAGNDQALTWARQLFSAANGEGLNNAGVNNFRVDVLIYVQQHPSTDAQTPQMAFKLHNAWVTSVSYTDLDASNGAILFETMQLVHEGITVAFTNADGTSATPGITLP